MREFGKVNLFLIGEQKCGTTTLHRFLINSTDEILSGRVKELQFFNRDTLPHVSEYEKNFKFSILKRKPKYAIDASPSYATYGLEDYTAIKRILSYNPKAKFIYITRDPIERYLSAYRFYNQRVVKKAQIWDPGEHSVFWKGMFSFLRSRPDGFSLEEFNEIEFSDKPIFNSLFRGRRSFHRKNLGQLIEGNNLLLLDISQLDSKGELTALLEEFLKVQLNPIDVPVVGATEKNTASLEVTATKQRLFNYYKELGEVE